MKELTEQERLETQNLLPDGHSYDDLSSKSDAKVVERKPGRPRAVPDRLIPKVQYLHRRGLGYRAIARELRQDGVLADWSTVRRIIKKSQGLGNLPEHP